MRSNKPNNSRPGRPLKERPVPTDVVRAFIQASADPLPKDPQTLRGLVHALVDRIQKNNARGGKFVRATIHHLAAVENMNRYYRGLNTFRHYFTPDADDVFNDLLNRDLNRISGSIAERKTPDHFVTAIAIQHHMLQTLLKEYPYQGNKMDWKVYWRQHQDNFIPLLTSAPCFCAYDAMPFPTRWGIYSGDRFSDGEFITFVLAKLHGASQRTIRAALLAVFPNK